MNRELSILRRSIIGASTLIALLVLGAHPDASAEAPQAAMSGFNAYVSKLELRLAKQHQAPDSFLASVGPGAKTAARLRRGELIIEQLTPVADAELPGALLHHWRGTAFVQGATAAEFERLMKDFNAYRWRFSPQVLQAGILTPHPVEFPDHLRASMRIRQHHVVTVVLDTTYDVRYGRLDAQHRYSASRSTKISEIDSPGTSREHALSESDEHGFLWRMNTYWSYEERDGGLYVQVESISLTRAIPAGLGWAIRPYVESVPRQSLEFTLRAVCNALKK